MSIDQRKLIGEFFKYVLYVSLGISGWLIKEAATDAKEEIHELRKEVMGIKDKVTDELKDMSKDIDRVDKRVLVLETKATKK